MQKHLPILKNKYIAFLFLLPLFLSLFSSCSSNKLDNDHLIEIIINDIKPSGDIRLEEIPSERGFHRINAINCPIGSEYNFYMIQMDGNEIFLGEFVVDDNKELISTNGGKKLSGLTFFYGGFMNGEFITLCLVSKNSDKKTCAWLVVHPNPIECKWDDGAQFNLVMLPSKKNDQFILKCSGLIPNEELIFTSKSEDEVMVDPISAEMDGTFKMFLLPAVIGKSGGQASFKFERKATGQSCTIKYYWGDEAILHKSK